MKFTHALCALSGSTIAIVLGFALSAPSAHAQAAEVPRPDVSGDFSTAYVMGNRGYYTNTKWLITDPTTRNSYGLNCRYSPNGKVRSIITSGAIVTAVFRNPKTGTTTIDPATDAIVMSGGAPWLRVSGSRDDLAYPVQGETNGECYVRANLKYVAPINLDSIDILKK